MYRRTAVVALGAALAGCAGGGDATPVPVSGSAATVSERAVAEAGYEFAGTDESTMNATLVVTVQGDIEGRAAEDVTATVPVARYRRATGDGPAVVAVAASPSVQVLENPPKSADPLGTLALPELLTFVQGVYRDPSGLQVASEHPVTVLGEETDLVTYRGTAVRDDERIEVSVHVLRVEDDDVVTAVAVHPASVDERARISTLLSGVRH